MDFSISRFEEYWFNLWISSMVY